MKAGPRIWRSPMSTKTVELNVGDVGARGAAPLLRLMVKKWL